MVDIQSVAAEIRRGKKIEDRKKLQGKNIMPPLLHRVAIMRKEQYVIQNGTKQYYNSSAIRATTMTGISLNIYY